MSGVHLHAVMDAAEVLELSSVLNFYVVNVENSKCGHLTL